MLPYITAHSGCENTPENSMESVRTGIALGADFVEVDVRLDPKGTPRLMKEDVLNITTRTVQEALRQRP